MLKSWVLGLAFLASGLGLCGAARANQTLCVDISQRNPGTPITIFDGGGSLLSLESAVPLTIADLSMFASAAPGRLLREPSNPGASHDESRGRVFPSRHLLRQTVARFRSKAGIARLSLRRSASRY